MLLLSVFWFLLILAHKACCKPCFGTFITIIIFIQKTYSCIHKQSVRLLQFFALLCFFLSIIYRTQRGFAQVIKLVFLRSCWQPKILGYIFSCCSRVRNNSQRWEQFVICAPGLDLPEEIRAANFPLIISESLLRACLFEILSLLLCV